MLSHRVLRVALATALLGSGALACSSASSGSPGFDTSETAPGVQALHDPLLATIDESEPAGRTPRVNDVLLVHGAWADGSSWSSVIEILQRDGYEVHAVQLAEQSVADDAALVAHAIAGIPRPLVVAGHSYGGFVMSEATGASTPNVTALVFVAAFALEQGESIESVSAPYPPTPVIAHLTIDAYGFATIQPDAFVQYFASDVPVFKSRMLAVVQHPIAAGVLGTPAGVPGWKTIPSYYQVSLDDQAIGTALEQFFAKRMGAKTIELEASHVSLVSHPGAIANLIEVATQ